MNKDIEHIIRDLDNYKTILEARASEVPNEIKNRLLIDVYVQNSIKTRFFVNSIDSHPLLTTESVSQYEIRSEAGYDGFLEFRTANRGRQSYREGRFHYQNAIENANLERVFDSFANSAFVV